MMQRRKSELENKPEASANGYLKVPGPLRNGASSDINSYLSVKDQLVRHLRVGGDDQQIINLNKMVDESIEYQNEESKKLSISELSASEHLNGKRP